MISIIIPTYNEEDAIAVTLGHLARVNGDCEVIVADGASTDQTCSRVKSIASDFPHDLRLVEAERNRALQLNQAAAVARSDVLLFLHADIAVPPQIVEVIETKLSEASVIGGNFQIVFEGGIEAGIFTWIYHVRRPFGIYYGDSGLFVRLSIFEELGGFKPIPIMDDYEFVRRLERRGKTAYLKPALLVSGRRWRVQGLVPTLTSWVWIQALYSLGVPAENLARWYAPIRQDSGARREESGASRQESGVRSQKKPQFPF